MDFEVNRLVDDEGPMTFGIADAIHLMRALPHDPNEENRDLVTRIVRATLGSVAVSVDQVIEEARRREQNINNDIAKLQGDVDDLERRLDSRRCEIAAYQADLNDMVIVREQLYKADQHTRVRPPPIPRDALRKPSAPPGARLASFPTISRSNFPGASRLERQ